MKARHMKETFNLSRILDREKAGPEESESMRELMAQTHKLELREAWEKDPTGEYFIYDMMKDGAFFGLEMKDILKADGIDLNTPADIEKAIKGYSMAMAFYEAHPDGLEGIQ